MLTIDLLEQALTAARALGYEIRQEWLQETMGGPCRIGQRKVLYIDLSLSAEEQLQQAILGLKAEPEAIGTLSLPRSLMSLLAEQN
ncbi:MAG: hypothetical protein KDB03_10620 [Planctomycetales bacterium]|nr:hypothetical protein [Planctomycetales bacterium]